MQTGNFPFPFGSRNIEGLVCLFKVWTCTVCTEKNNSRHFNSQIPRARALIPSSMCRGSEISGAHALGSTTPWPPNHQDSDQGSGFKSWVSASFSRLKFNEEKRRAFFPPVCPYFPCSFLFHLSGISHLCFPCVAYPGGAFRVEVRPLHSGHLNDSEF